MYQAHEAHDIKLLDGCRHTEVRTEGCRNSILMQNQSRIHLEHNASLLESFEATGFTDIRDMKLLYREDDGISRTSGRVTLKERVSDEAGSARGMPGPSTLPRVPIAHDICFNFFGCTRSDSSKSDISLKRFPGFYSLNYSYAPSSFYDITMHAASAPPLKRKTFSTYRVLLETELLYKNIRKHWFKMFNVNGCSGNGGREEMFPSRHQVFSGSDFRAPWISTSRDANVPVAMSTDQVIIHSRTSFQPLETACRREHMRHLYRLVQQTVAQVDSIEWKL
ncbi:hypothetical protein C8Q75DRAFT_731222 [Abortiporus biennis]|nr:hypothetical protein C8Q75DRAFT_731222 [Abortiporus biennis]